MTQDTQQALTVKKADTVAYSPSVNTALTDLCSSRTNDVGAGVGPLSSDKSPEYCSQS